MVATINTTKLREIERTRIASVQTDPPSGPSGAEPSPGQPSTDGPLRSKTWIYGPARDFWLINGGCGLLVLPVVAASFLCPQIIGTALLTYTLALGLPHLTATYVRLHLDEDCQQQHRWLAVAAPLAAATLIATIVYAWNLLPLLAFTWFLLQSWHANRQNFGIMRRYIRMFGSDPSKAVNRLAALVVELLPWACVVTALMNPCKVYFGYPLYLPPVEILVPTLIFLWAASITVIALYLGFEAYEFFHKRTVPGRVLCVLSGALINVAAWVVVDDMAWGYLVVSSWHALQYMTYVHSFRSAPPPGARVLKLSFKPHFGLLFAGGLMVYLLGKGLEWWLPATLVVFHLGMNLHHYLADAFIWRAPKPATLKS